MKLELDAMKTQIVLNSFAAPSFEVLPVILPSPPSNTSKAAGKSWREWMARLARRPRPAHRLPGAVMGVRLSVCRRLHPSN